VRCHSLLLSGIGVMGNMFLFMARYSGCGHIGRNVRGTLKRNGSITGPVLIFSAASGLAFLRSKVFVLHITIGRCILKTLHLVPFLKALKGSVKEFLPSVDNIHHAFLSVK